MNAPYSIGCTQRIGTYSAKVLVYHIKKLTEENPHLKALLPELDAVYLASDNFFKQVSLQLYAYMARHCSLAPTNCLRLMH
jgi:hypothetical protein